MSVINLNHLETFCILSETLSFSKTAKLLFTSQPAISRKIKILENNLGHELFLRNKRGVILTKEGIALKDKVFSNYKELSSGLGVNREQVPIYRIGSIYEAGTSFLVPALGSLIKTKRIEQFELVLRSSDELIQMLLKAELDYILIHFRPSLKSIETLEVGDDKTVMIGSKNQNLDILERLEEIPLITYHQNDLFTEKFLKNNFNKSISKKFKIIASVNSHLAMIELLKSIPSFAIIPLSSLPKAEKANVNIIKHGTKKHSLYLCTRENYLTHKNNRLFLHELADTVKAQKLLAIN